MIRATVLPRVEGGVRILEHNLISRRSGLSARCESRLMSRPPYTTEPPVRVLAGPAPRFRNPDLGEHLDGAPPGGGAISSSTTGRSRPNCVGSACASRTASSSRPRGRG